MYFFIYNFNIFLIERQALDGKTPTRTQAASIPSPARSQPKTMSPRSPATIPMASPPSQYSNFVPNVPPRSFVSFTPESTDKMDVDVQSEISEQDLKSPPTNALISDVNDVDSAEGQSDNFCGTTDCQKMKIN